MSSRLTEVTCLIGLTQKYYMQEDVNDPKAAKPHITSVNWSTWADYALLIELELPPSNFYLRHFCVQSTMGLYSKNSLLGCECSCKQKEKMTHIIGNVQQAVL